MAEGGLLVLCLALIGLILVAHLFKAAEKLFKKITGFLEALTVWIAALTIVGIVIIQLTPLEFRRLKERSSELLHSVTAAAVSRVD